MCLLVGSTDKIVVGHVGEWDLLSGDVIEHKVHYGTVLCMALSGDKIVTSDSMMSLE
jgi:hypothetical protein